MRNDEQLSALVQGGLTLADGSMCGIAARDPISSSLVAQLIEVMQLRPDGAPDRLVLVTVDGDTGEGRGISRLIQPSGPSGNVTGGRRMAVDRLMAQREFPPEVEVVQFMTKHVADGDERVLELMHLSQAALDHAHSHSAMLLHGALVELEGCSVLLAGPGGVGKSTACARLPAPWRAVCDDSTLVVCGRGNIHWAHPWPTWSDFLYGGAGGSWDVQTPVRLTAIFFLEQAAVDRAESCGEAEAVCLLLEAAEQGSRLSLRGKGKTESRMENLKRFEIICELAKSIPCYRLETHISGAFWHEIERVLAGP